MPREDGVVEVFSHHTRTVTPILCAHGKAGFCWDELPQQARTDANFLYGAAYDYAVGRGRDLAEKFACWLVDQTFANHEYDGYSIKISLRSELEEFLENFSSRLGSGGLS